MSIVLSGTVIEPNVKQLVELREGIIPQANMDLALIAVCELLGKSVDWPIGWSNEAIVKGRGEFVGSFSKRIGKWLYAHHRYKIGSDDLARVCKIALDGMQVNQAYLMDFDERLTWRSGDFGDDGSCWWDDGQRYLRCFKAIGGKAVRLFSADNPTDGRGRAWIVPNQPDPGSFLLFNGYLDGYHDSGPTLLIARFVAEAFGWVYKRVVPVFYTAKERRTFFYLNGNTGYIMGPPTVVGARSYQERFDMFFDDSLIFQAEQEADDAYEEQVRHL